MNLDTILAAADLFADPGEPIGVMIVRVRGRHDVRVVIGGEVVTHVEAPTRERAVEMAIRDLQDAAASAADRAFVDAVGWRAAQ